MQSYFKSVKRQRPRSAFTPVKRYKLTRPGMLVAMKRKLNRIKKPEVKDFQVSSTVFDPTAAAGQIDYVSGIVVGTSDTQRIGKQIRVVKIYVRCALSVTPAAGQDLCMIFLIKDLESNGVVPTISGAVNAIFTSFNPLIAVQQPGTKDRFKIMKQWAFTSAAALSDYNLPNREFTWNGDIVVNYGDDTAAQTGAAHNALYLVGLSTADTFDANYTVDLGFTDA